MEGRVVWLTGLPGSGKSMVAKALARELDKRSVKVQILSADLLRKTLTPKPKYTEEERELVYGTLVLIAKLLSRNNVNVIIDATGNRRSYRDKARKEISDFHEVYVKCPLKICIQRETKREETLGAPKDIYAKAFTTKSKTVPGVGVPYEEPTNPEVIVATDKLNPETCAKKIFGDLFTNY
ncbi:MAG: adenylyl-sulfate kinase [Candidatus Bathyarchaeota archaeon]